MVVSKDPFVYSILLFGYVGTDRLWMEKHDDEDANYYNVNGNVVAVFVPCEVLRLFLVAVAW